MHEDQGRAIPLGIPISKGASCFSEAEFAKWTTGSTKSKNMNILRPPSVSGSYGETRSGNVGYRIPGIPHSAVQQQDTNRTETVTKLIQQLENHPKKESILQDLNKTEEINTFRKVEEVDHRHGQYRDLRALRNLFQETMPRLC